VSGENAAARDVAIVTSKSNRVQVMKAADLTKMIKTKPTDTLSTLLREQQ
jgi:hypothetical protein